MTFSSIISVFHSSSELQDLADYTGKSLGSIAGLRQIRHVMISRVTLDGSSRELLKQYCPKLDRVTIFEKVDDGLQEEYRALASTNLSNLNRKIREVKEVCSRPVFEPNTKFGVFACPAEGVIYKEAPEM